MSERILKALMQLFAIIAKVEDHEEVQQDHALAGRDIVKLFLSQELTTELVDEYLQLFDEYLEKHQGKSKRKDGKKKRTSVNSVKVLRICTQINEELAQKQKIIVLVRILEFININEVITDQEREFVETVADTFNVSREEFEQINKFVQAPKEEEINSPFFLNIDNKDVKEESETKHIKLEGIDDLIRILSVPSVNIFFLRYFGSSEIYLNGQLILNNRNNIFTQGSSIRSSKFQPIYYSDIISQFMADTSSEKIVFKADNIEYRFKNGGIGLHDFNLIEESGRLTGIMGGSGAGKSTLLNILNGNYTPTRGKVTINGIDIHHEKDEIEGVIGYVSQDDLLIEELTVFQNLFYNAKLCFGSLPDKIIAKKVLKTLSSLGLYETKDLKVGSPLDKTISGGQRKRLNIALELIREPSVLFVDEPTSGLSSRDSENIMDLLKELALKGKLIFVVIHQPSSDIFKMFDKLLILDQGGFPIYNGNPVDAVIYFKTLVNHVNSNESECPTCGNVNPEQIFNIIESKVVDEYGNLTHNRKTKPKEWNVKYKELLEPKSLASEYDDTEIPENTTRIPNLLKQFKVFFTRDILSKFTNTQYLVINLVEAPALAAILAFFVKFYNPETNADGYLFRDSENLPQFLFISVVVSLFLGLTVAAEEIIKDQKILKRESFLNLSKGSYLFSKISIMFIISAVQSLLYVVVGNLILGIHGMWFAYWLIMFSTSCFANLLGLNISASFNSAKVIYILIPILIIPQLLFSGVIVKFDKLNPWFSAEDRVPFIGNVMASRWAYEALAVTQFKENSFNSKFYEYDKEISRQTYMSTFWASEMIQKTEDIKSTVFTKDKSQVIQNKKEINEILGKNEKRSLNDIIKNNLSLLRAFNDFATLKNEVVEIEKSLNGYSCDCAEALSYNEVQVNDMLSLNKFLTVLKANYENLAEKARGDKEKYIKEVMESIGKEEFLSLKDKYTNESLENFVVGKGLGDFMIEKDNRFIQKKELIYLDPENKGFFSAHFYAPTKNFFGIMIETFWANIIVIWGMTILFIITLYFDVLKFLLAAPFKFMEWVQSKMKKSTT